MNKVGRPLKFQSVEELDKQIDAYFKDCDPHMEVVTEWVQSRDSKGQLKKDKNGLNYLVEVTHKVMTEQKPYTITGLALSLGTSRETLLDYREKEGFSDSIKAAKDRCQAFVEHSLFTAPNVTGPIFNLKNNYDWKDTHNTEHSGTVKVQPILNGLSKNELSANDSHQEAIEAPQED